jgi:4-hydroxy-tetrahydrodipicolinate reductase
MKMGILGICGRMGNKIYQFYQGQYDIVGIDIKQHPHVQTYAHINDILDIDILDDFSSVSSKEILVEAMKRKIPIISGTTGYKMDEIDELNKLAISFNTKFYWSSNFAKGIKLFQKLIMDCNKEFEIFDFIEIHATTKKDAPSGTARMLASSLNIPEDKIQSLRLYQAPAIHELIFASNNERVIIRHEVLNTEAFIWGFDEELKKMIGGSLC